jgi:hypothetical protein
LEQLLKRADRKCLSRTARDMSRAAAEGASYATLYRRGVERLRSALELPVVD